MEVSLIKFMSFSTAEQYPKLVNGQDKNQICAKRERARGRESSRKKGITNNGLRKQFQTSHTIFFFFFSLT